jgi:hypothetical protein
MNRMMNRTMNQTANCHAQMNRITAPVLGLALFIMIGPTVANAVHAVATVLLELGRLSLAAMQILFS